MMCSVVFGIMAVLHYGESSPAEGDMSQRGGLDRQLRYSARAIAALLAAFAASIHFAVAPDHFAETFAFGTFMVVVGTAQLAGGFLLLLRPSRALVFAMIVLTIAVMVVYGVSRTTGLPFGPVPWVPEDVMPIDVASKVDEVLLLAILAYLLRATRERTRFTR